MGLIFNILHWLLIAFLIFVAIILLSLYIRGAFRWRPLFKIKRVIAPQSPHFLTAVKGITGSLETTGQVTDFWSTADDIQKARLAAIGSARHRILFETFMMTPGRRANDFADAIAQKAIEGVEIQMLVDVWGARSLSDKYWQRLRSVGVQIAFFNPFDWRAPANFAGRTHRKLLVIDGDRALVGGAGVSNLWDGTEKSDDKKSWLDIEAAFEGDIVHVLAAVFQSHWQGYRQQSKTGRNLTTDIDMGAIYPAVDNNPLTESEPRPVDSDRAQASEKASEKTSEKTAAMLVTLGTKPSYRDSSIETLKQTLIACAKKRVWISSPYLLPNHSTRNLLITAQQSGVDVRILTTSTASDKKPVYYASVEQYGSLLKAGIKILEYQPSMLHAKMLIIDDDWANIGSANFDYRSFLHNDELDIVTNSHKLIRQVEQVFESGFAQSEQICIQPWQQRSWLKYRVLGNLVRLIQWQL